MADVIKKSTNKFTKGLVMDFSPENTRNEVLTHALNATLLTFNGNELSLQNDMGNARVETAFLPEGYIPVGTCEYGGIIYIVSYNPLEDKSQIGCFPSPERNISNDELGKSDTEPLTSNYFQEMVENLTNVPTGTIKNNAQYILLKESNLNPGDKFLVYASDSIYEEKLANLQKIENGKEEFIANPVLALNIVAIEDSGKIVYLNSDLRTYEKEIFTDDSSITYNYHILGEELQGSSGFTNAKIDIDSYRNVVSSGYNVFRSKTSGRLALLAELIMIDSYTVTHSVVPTKDANNEVIPGSFDVVLHTEVTPNLTTSNFATAPKLSYYYLPESQGYLQYADANKGEVVRQELFYKSNNNWELSNKFLNTQLSSVYTATTTDINLNEYMRDYGKYRFVKPETYHGKMIPYVDPNLSNLQEVYTRVLAGNFYRIKAGQIVNDSFDNTQHFVTNLNIDFYVHNPEGGEWTKWHPGTILSPDITYYTRQTTLLYEDAKRSRSKDPDQSEELYILDAAIVAASPEVVQDETIIKYIPVVKFVHNIITEHEYDGVTQLWIKIGENEFEAVNTSTLDWDNTTYWVQSDTTVFVPITQDQVDKYTTFYYYPTPNYFPVDAKIEQDYWDFTNYELDTAAAPWGFTMILYRKRVVPEYTEASEEELRDYWKKASYETLTDDDYLYYKSTYTKINPSNLASETKQVFMVPYRDTYLTNSEFTPNPAVNYIEGYQRPNSDYDYTQDGHQYDAPMGLFCLAEFIPQLDATKEEGLTQYEDVKLGTIQLPKAVADNELDLPFKYNYTIIPCMNYGKLEHLTVRNTVDFSQLHAFNNSNFNTWKYHIDGNQIRLTFGADVFDTFEDYKVDGLILEFYDLWGFAGSLEINDKKSYSGVFTKLISLNDPNALNKRCVVNGQYYTGYKRNIGIAQKEGQFYLNDTPIHFTQNEGWSYIDDMYNDCGTLYPNIIYGVKTYLRQTTAEGTYKFTRKKDFFLYTLPVFNDFYYTVSDFSTITNPTLDFILTYKITDSSIIQAVNSDTITDGYATASDYVQVSEYLRGQTDQIAISGTKYYKYVGTSNVALEIGLKQEYQQYGLSYDSQINNLFSCSLHLISNDDPERSFTVVTGESADLTKLNYKSETGLTVNSNYVKFGEGSNPNTFTIDTGYFTQYNFISSENRSTIPIKYQFIVGYPFAISDIRSTEVPMTTVCALLHADKQGRYNWDDFGLHNISEDINSPVYVSKAMLLNSGTKDVEFFGVVSHVNIDPNKTAEEQYKIEHEYTQSSVESHVAGKLNTGKPLSVIKNYIGKLTFCQPHAHAHPTEPKYGTNVYDTNGSLYNSASSGPRISGANGGWCTKDYAINRYNDYDDCYGIVPVPDGSDSMNLRRHPLYNLSVNTQSSLEQGDLFISTMDFAEKTGSIYGYDINQHRTKVWSGKITSRAFVGLDGQQLKTFYEKFINSVKKIYAYNPDYDMLPVQIGSITTDSNPVSFVSNMISKNAALTFPSGKILNDYIYIGYTSLNKYFKFMQEYSGQDPITAFAHKDDTTTIIPQLAFQPNYTYLGLGENAYLVSSLTYNTSAPAELATQLEIKTANQTCVKHSDGSYVFIEGTPNKNLLYGFDHKTSKLLQLDVTNYEISTDGTLELKTRLDAGSGTLVGDVTADKMAQLVSNYYTFEHDIANSAYGHSKLKLDVKMTPSPVYSVAVDTSLGTVYFNTSPNIQVIPFQYETQVKELGDGYEYTSISATNNQSTWYEIKSVGLTIDINHDSLKQLDLSILNSIMKQSADPAYFEYTTSDGEQAVYEGSYRQLGLPARAKMSNSGQLVVESNQPVKTVLTAITPKKVSFVFNRKQSLAYASDSIVYTTQTSAYHTIENHRYLVKDEYKSARFRGTSLVINDLLYKPHSEHRLFVKSTNYKYDGDTHRGIIYYRDCDSPNSWGAHYNTFSGADATSYNYSGYNHLFLYTGPCFTPDYL